MVRFLSEKFQFQLSLGISHLRINIWLWADRKITWRLKVTLTQSIYLLICVSTFTLFSIFLIRLRNTVIYWESCLYRQKMVFYYSQNYSMFHSIRYCILFLAINWLTDWLILVGNPPYRKGLSTTVASRYTNIIPV